MESIPKQPGICSAKIKRIVRLRFGAGVEDNAVPVIRWRIERIDLQWFKSLSSLAHISGQY